jgi:hypothetical protein
MFNYGFNRTKENVQRLVNKFEQNQLEIEEILNDDDIVNDVKSNSNCKLANL